MEETIEQKDNFEGIKVSVIIPVYNGDKYLTQCIDTILVQTLKDIEVIIIDDGSTDGSLEIAKKYAEIDKRVKVLTQENRGAGAARNYGLKYATGRYVSFLDADDFFHNEMLKRSYEYCERYELDFVTYRCMLFDNIEKEYKEHQNTIRETLLPEKKAFSYKDIEKDLFKLFVGWAWDKLFRRDFISDNMLLFQEQASTNDMLFVYSALIDAERIGCLDEVLVSHRMNVETSISRTRGKNWKCFYNALVELKKHIVKRGLVDKLEQDFINYVVHFSIWNLDTIEVEIFDELYNFLKNEGFEQLGVIDKKAEYFYNKYEYGKYRIIAKLESKDYQKHNISSDLYREHVFNKGKLLKDISTYLKNFLTIRDNFDSKYYKEHYEESLKLIKIPSLHFFLRGVYYGHNPNELFDVVDYILDNPEVARSGDNALLHALLNEKLDEKSTE